MGSRILGLFAYLSSGVVALVLAVYIASSMVRSGSAAKTELLAQNEVPPPRVTADPAVGGVAVELGQAPTLEAGAAFLEPYIYDTREGRRNPFRPFSMLDPSAYSAVVMGPTTPLERFELDELKLTGILWDVKNPRAMFIDPNKEVHVVSKDDRIGRRRGYVAVIREGEVVVVELTTFSGEPVYSTRVLRIER